MTLLNIHVAGFDRRKAPREDKCYSLPRSSQAAAPARSRVAGGHPNSARRQAPKPILCKPLNVAVEKAVGKIGCFVIPFTVNRGALRAEESLCSCIETKERFLTSFEMTRIDCFFRGLKKPREAKIIYEIAFNSFPLACRCDPGNSGLEGWTALRPIAASKGKLGRKLLQTIGRASCQMKAHC